MSDDEADARPIEQLLQDDWTDQDLLTRTEARERLFGEIERTRAQLREVQHSAEIALLQRRLRAMESVCDDYGPASTS